MLNLQDFHRGDWSAAFVAALEAAGRHDAEIRFPDATLDFAPGCGVDFAGVISNHDNPRPRRVALPLFNTERITLTGGPRTLLRFKGHTIPLLLHKSRGARVQSLKIDWVEPFYSQGRVLESAEDYFDVAVDSGYPHDVADHRLRLRGELCWGWAEIDPETLELLPGRRLNCGEDYPARIPVEDRGGGVVRFHGKVDTRPVAGSIMVLRHGKRETPAVVIDDCADVALDSLWIYHAGGMGVIAQNSRDVRLGHVQVTPPPGSGRAFSTCADATHLVNCSGALAIENCLFEHQFDDGSNIHGVYAPILESSGGTTLLAELRHPQHRGLAFAAPGDCVRAVDGATLRTLGEVAVEAVQEHPDGTFKLEVSEPLPAGATALENLTRRPTSTPRRQQRFPWQHPARHPGLRAGGSGRRGQFLQLALFGDTDRRRRRGLVRVGRGRGRDDPAQPLQPLRLRLFQPSDGLRPPASAPGTGAGDFAWPPDAGGQPFQRLSAAGGLGHGVPGGGGQGQPFPRRLPHGAQRLAPPSRNP